MTRSLIEQWLPAATVGAESLRERAAFTALPPLFAMHVWWARRPLVASRAAIVASLLPAWPTEEEAASDSQAAEILAGLRAEFPKGESQYRDWYVQALGITGDPVLARKLIAAAKARGTKTKGNAYGYERAFKVTPDRQMIERIHRLAALRAGVDRPPTVVDPFAGGGSIPLESGRFGCNTIASELNAVATAILDGTVRIPAELGPNFTDVLKAYGERWIDRIEKRLAPYFPHNRPDEQLAYIWAHTVPCPTTGLPTPLSPDYFLAKGRAGRNVAVNLDVDPNSGTVSRTIVEGAQAKDVGKRSTYKGGSAVSIWDPATTFDGEYIREQAMAGKLDQMLLAVSVTRPGVRGRHFRAPSDADIAAVEAAEQELATCVPAWEVAGLVPNEPIPAGSKTREPRNMALTRWRDMFTPRQLLTNITALEELHRVAADAKTDLADEQANAVPLYLAFALDKTVDYNSRLSSWDATRVKVRNTFDRHDFGFKWSFAELDGGSAILPWAVKQIVSAYRGTANLAHRADTHLEGEQEAVLEVSIASATSLPVEGGSIDAIVTDPPYYDNVMYTEVSDFFYVWMKRALREVRPEFCGALLTDKEREVVANPSMFSELATHSGRGKRKAGTKTAAELADQHYEQMLTQCFREGYRVLKDDGVMTVMFTHKRVDAWDTLGAALLESGFTIHSSWPVHTEPEKSLHQAKKNAVKSTIFLTCRKRHSADPAWWDDIKGDVAHTARKAAEELAEQGITGVDLSIATYGPVLSILSRNWPVYTGRLDEEGEREVLRPDAALDLAREEVADLKKRGLLGGREVNFDRVTDWWLIAWNDFQAAQFPFDEARKLSIAMHLEVDDLARIHKLIQATSGTVTLLTPAQRRTAGGLNPDATSWPALIDALHALMVTYDEDGLQAARAWIERTGKGDDSVFRDLVRAALNAVPRKKNKGEFARPEARTLESLRATLFDDIAPPPDPDADVAEQLALVVGSD